MSRENRPSHITYEKYKDADKRCSLLAFSLATWSVQSPAVSIQNFKHLTTLCARANPFVLKRPFPKDGVRTVGFTSKMCSRSVLNCDT